MTSNAHSHVHEHVHPHADSESDLARVQRLAVFLESHFGEVHVSVPEPEKGHEEGQDEEAPEPVLLIRLDEADALVHLRSMVSYSFSVHFTPLPLPLYPFTSFLGDGVEGKAEISSRTPLPYGLLELICLPPVFPSLHSTPFFSPFQTVTSANETLRKRVESVVDMALTTVSSLSEMYSGSTSSAVNDAAIKPVEKTPDPDVSDVNPTTAEGEDTMEEPKEAEM